MEKHFYRIDGNGYPKTGSGILIPDGFTEFLIGKEPEDLSLALQDQASIEEQDKFRNQRNRILSALDKPLWIASLSDAEKLELNTFYQALLNSTIKGVIPTAPEFCNKILGA